MVIIAVLALAWGGLFFEPLAGKRYVKVTERKTKQDRAHFLEEIAEKHTDAEKITLVMDNLETHKPGSQI